MRRAYTLIELLIVIVIITVILAIVITPIIGLFGGLFPNYSEGERTGIVYKISKKGMIFKSFEGEMNLGGMSESNGMAVPNKFEFSVMDEDVVKKIETSASSGKRVTVRYSQYWMKPMKIDSPYVILEVKDK